MRWLVNNNHAGMAILTHYLRRVMFFNLNNRSVLCNCAWLHEYEIGPTAVPILHMLQFTTIFILLKFSFWC